MIWTYRVFRDSQGRYSIREVFYERDQRIVNYSKTPVAVVGVSLEEMMQLVQWFKEAFDLPVLSLEEIDAQVARHGIGKSLEQSKNISLKQVMAELATDADPVSQS
jgi:CO dehydrogenase/acetyl-CoA synthase epsilon subunit